MNADVDKLQGELAELQGEREAFRTARTKEDTAAAAQAFLETARARTDGVAPVVIQGHAFEVRLLQEKDEDGPAVSGPKHWHVFHVIASKRGIP